MAKNREDSKGHEKNPVNKKESAREAMRGEEDCRCKEMSQKKPRELLKVMIGDLSFWKKKK